MSDKQVITQLNFRVASLKESLTDCQRELEQYRSIQTQADSKIKALNKMHNDKVKSLLNSIQILKKEKASVQNLSKEHKRSKLIQQLNKEILDQDTVIDVLRKIIYDQKGKQDGRKLCDQLVVKALTKGPERIRPETRQELRIQIEKLRNSVQGKGKPAEAQANNKQDDSMSQISEVGEKSVVNQNQEVYRRLKELQGQNESLKLQLSTKGRIIQKLRGQVKEKQRIKSELQLVVNQAQIASQKITTYQRLLRESKQTMNNKIMQLYQRQLRVQQLQLDTRANNDKFRQAHQSTNILIQQIRQQKQQIQAEYELLKKQNQNILLQNITLKKRQDEQKTKISQIRNDNSQQQKKIAQKLSFYEQQTNKILSDNNDLQEQLRKMQSTLFQERAQWVEEKNNLINNQPSSRTVIPQNNSELVEEMAKLRQENRTLKETLQSGGGKGKNDSLLLQRLENYRIRLEMYDKKGDANKERQLYDQLFKKYQKLLEEYQKLQNQLGSIPSKLRRKYVVQLTSKQEQNLEEISSGISGLKLQDIDSDILDNFDSDYDYQLVVNDGLHKHKGMPRVTQQDRELLKLINSDLWDFVTDPALDNKLQDLLDDHQVYNKEDEQKLFKRIRQIRNISSPVGKKFTMYDSQVVQLDNLSENVSATSALPNQMQKYDSDVDIDVKNNVKGAPSKIKKNFEKISQSVSSQGEMSSIRSGQSGLGKKKKEKASVFKLGKDGSVSSYSSNSEMMNSDVSSVGVDQEVLKGIDSDVSVDFRKKKTRK